MTRLGRPGPEVLVAAAALAGVLGGLALRWTGREQAADLLWAAVTAALLVPLTLSVVRSLLRRDLGVDAIALVAMATALGLGEFLAGAVVALMLSGGNALEAAAGRRARRDLAMLVSRAPRTARRVTPDGIDEVPVDDVLPGDLLLVRAGEVVPVDGRVDDEPAVLDESALTGEPLPVTRRAGDDVRSGVANAGEAFHLLATRPAAESAYAALVRLVAASEGHRAPFVRMADRYAAVLLPVTLAVAGGAWLASGDPVRALAVLVVATPCPLILAAPIAYVSGVSRAARRGVILKGGVVVERLGEVRTVLLDKTGTLTAGHPALDRVEATDGVAADEVLRLAASVEQHSAHVLAAALVSAARARGMALAAPTGISQEHGQGIEGTVEGRLVTVGSEAWLRGRGVPVPPSDDAGGPGTGGEVLVGVDGAPAGRIRMSDHVRPDAAEMVAGLRRAGVAQVAMVTGDRRDVAEAVAARVGVDRVWAECSPEDKLGVVREVRADPARAPVLMVGDGINDAPALAMADVGVAMGAAAGATVASEAADAVVLVDRVDRVADAIRISRRASGIARQSVLWGMGMSFAAMGLAAAGYLSPVAGALLQEAIDVAVILNALRALRA
jgi:heavy metal translocating P-type ATPase